MNRYTHSFALAFLGYLILFGGFLLFESLYDSAPKQTEQMIPITMIQEDHTPKPITHHTPSQKKSPHHPTPQEANIIQKEESVILSSKTPNHEEIAQNTPQLKPKEILQEVIAKLSEKTEPSQPKNTLPQTTEQPNERAQIAQKTPTPTTPPTPTPLPIQNKQSTPPKKADTTLLQKQFFTTLKAKIEHNKYYPSIAKRRGIEGLVEVKFEILPNGTLCNLQIVSGHKVFFESAKEAIERSFPLQVPTEIQGELGFVTLMLEYKIL